MTNKFSREHDPIKYNNVSGKRHLDLNKLMKESFVRLDKLETKRKRAVIK